MPSDPGINVRRRSEFGDKIMPRAVTPDFSPENASMTGFGGRGCHEPHQSDPE
jgi:hypothetical protein